jgi:hypothetical protein
MPKSAKDQQKPSSAKSVELCQQYRQIGSAAILGALAAKMKQADKDEADRRARTRRAA